VVPGARRKPSAGPHSSSGTDESSHLAGKHVQLHYLARYGAAARTAVATPELPVAQGPFDPPDLDAAHDSGTPAPCSGVSGADRPVIEAPARSFTRPLRRLLVVAGACLLLLGQGERCKVDPRFASPSATLRTYWQALLNGDAETAWSCFVEARPELPLPGMVWFLPPSDSLKLADFRALPVTNGRVLVRYQVEYVPHGVPEVRSFPSAEEVVRMHGEWRIARRVGEAAYPDWTPTSRPVDI